MIKQILTIILSIPLALLALLILFGGATLIIAAMCIALYAYVIGNGVVAIFKAINLGFQRSTIKEK